jgi:hypothetical protein
MRTGYKIKEQDKLHFVTISARRSLQATPNGKNKCSDNIPNITNHYIIIVGKKYDTSKKQWYYLFYEVGTSSPNKGKSSENRLYINVNIMEGKTAYITNCSENYYIVTEVRKNIGQTY